MVLHQDHLVCLDRKPRQQLALDHLFLSLGQLVRVQPQILLDLRGLWPPLLLLYRVSPSQYQDL